MRSERKAVAGGLIGSMVGLVWVTLGGWAVLAMVSLGILGGLIGWMLDRPETVITWLERLKQG